MVDGLLARPLLPNIALHRLTLHACSVPLDQNMAVVRARDCMAHALVTVTWTEQQAPRQRRRDPANARYSQFWPTFLGRYSILPYLTLTGPRRPVTLFRKERLLCRRRSLADA